MNNYRQKTEKELLDARRERYEYWRGRVNMKGSSVIDAWEQDGWGYVTFYQPHERDSWVVFRTNLTDYRVIAYPSHTEEAMKREIERNGWQTDPEGLQLTFEF